MSTFKIPVNICDYDFSKVSRLRSDATFNGSRV